MRIAARTLEGRWAHAFLDGVDVSNLCVEADDDEGWVDLLVKSMDGRYKIDGWGEPIIKRHTGKVVIELRHADIDTDT